MLFILYTQYICFALIHVFYLYTFRYNSKSSTLSQYLLMLFYCCIECVCPLLTPSAEREEDFTLTETTPTSPSPGSYSPARSVHSVGVSSASSPTAAVSPEYTGVPSTTGETGRAVTRRYPKKKAHVVPLRQHICLCVRICVYQALFSHIPGPLHTQ